MEIKDIVKYGTTLLIIVVLFGALAIYVGQVVYSNDIQNQQTSSGTDNFIYTTTHTINTSDIDKEKFLVTSSSATAHNNSWLEFDGVNDFIEIDEQLSLNLTDRNFSIVFWAKPTGDGERNVVLDIVGGSNLFGIRGSGVWNCYNGTWGNIASPIHINETWQHLVYNYDSTILNMSIYFNNVLNVSLIKKPQGEFFPNIISTNSNSYHGSLDELRFYNRSLTDAEISEIYNSGRIANSSLPSDGLVLWYSFDEGTGTTVYDKSGNGNHGS